VLEIVDDFDGDTYRAMYTLKLRGVVYGCTRFKGSRSEEFLPEARNGLDQIATEGS
jgi:hypothetical protein